MQSELPQNQDKIGLLKTSVARQLDAYRSFLLDSENFTSELRDQIAVNLIRSLQIYIYYKGNDNELFDSIMNFLDDNNSVKALMGARVEDMQFDAYGILSSDAGVLYEKKLQDCRIILGWLNGYDDDFDNTNEIADEPDFIKSANLDLSVEATESIITYDDTLNVVFKVMKLSQQLDGKKVKLGETSYLNVGKDAYLAGLFLSPEERQRYSDAINLVYIFIISILDRNSKIVRGIQSNLDLDTETFNKLLTDFSNIFYTKLNKNEDELSIDRKVPEDFFADKISNLIDLIETKEEETGRQLFGVIEALKKHSQFNLIAEMANLAVRSKDYRDGILSMYPRT